MTTYPVGKIFFKTFNGRKYKGVITHVGRPHERYLRMYQVRYSDGDEEGLDQKQLTKLIAGRPRIIYASAVTDLMDHLTRMEDLCE
jgi:hypothetical protein